VAAVGHLAVDVQALEVDALSLSADQCYGPQGAAALFVRQGVRILPLLEGGGQEHGGRSGTEAMPAIVGMGQAAELSRQRLATRAQRLSRLRDALRDGLLERLGPLRLNGSWKRRLPHNLHLCVEGVASESLVLGLDQAGVAAGLGSACNSKAMRPSHVLKAMGLTDEEAAGALVLSVGEPTTDQDIERALTIIPAVVRGLRQVVAATARAA
jgi:cysteine desulfurase